MSHDSHNFSVLENDFYKRISKYINVDNFEFFNPLFDNSDIVFELFPYLHYDIVKNHPKFNLELWIGENINWVINNNFKLLEPFLINKDNNEYKINNKIYILININNNNRYYSSGYSNSNSDSGDSNSDSGDSNSDSSDNSDNCSGYKHCRDVCDVVRKSCCKRKIYSPKKCCSSKSCSKKSGWKRY